MPATAWDLFCSAWFSVFSHWLTANSSFSHRSCSLSGWQCLVVLLCSARFIFSVGLSKASAFLWPAMSPALRYRGPNNGPPDVNRLASPLAEELHHFLAGPCHLCPPGFGLGVLSQTANLFSLEHEIHLPQSALRSRPNMVTVGS